MRGSLANDKDPFLAADLGVCSSTAAVVYSIPNTIKPTARRFTKTLAKGELGTPGCTEFSFCTSERC